MIPSTLLFWQLLQKEVFASNTETFIQENIIYPDSYLIRHEFNFDSKSIRIYMGGETVPEDIITMWRTKLTSNEKLKDATLQVLQAKDDNAFTSSNFVTLSDMYSKIWNCCNTGMLKFSLYENNYTNLPRLSLSIRLVKS